MDFHSVISRFDLFDKTISDSVWAEVSMPVQIEKLNSNGILETSSRQAILDQLKVRPALLAHFASEIYKTRGRCRFLEVGTAEGLQSITIAKNVEASEVYTCDIRDVRHPSFHKLENMHFVLGNSKDLSSNINGTIDMCWIDGSHDHYAVINDFLSILHLTNEETVWIFDDFDKRFGCWHDINTLLRHFEKTYAVNFGKTASGNPSIISMGIGLKK